MSQFSRRDDKSQSEAHFYDTPSSKFLKRNTNRRAHKYVNEHYDEDMK